MTTLSSLSIGLLFSALCFATASATGADTAGQSIDAANFVRSSCQSTTYPLKCVESLIGFTPVINKSPLRLAHMALRVSLSRANTTNAFVHKVAKFKGLRLRERGAINDCCQVIDDTVEKLTNSVRELKDLTPGSDFFWHVSNLETWISAALTDENTCVDGFAGPALRGRIRATIRKRMVDVGQVTSNALALITQYATKN